MEERNGAQSHQHRCASDTFATMYVINLQSTSNWLYTIRLTELRGIGDIDWTCSGNLDLFTFYCHFRRPIGNELLI